MSGKIGNVLKFNKDGGNVDLVDFSILCFGNLDFCFYGFLIFFWIKLDEFCRYFYYFFSLGIDVYLVGKNLYVVVYVGNRKWEVWMYGLESGIW